MRIISVRTSVCFCLFWVLLVGCGDKGGSDKGDGGSDAAGDSDGSGNSDGDGDGDGDSDSDGDTVKGDADFEVEVSLSPKISTVGIVEWSIDKSAIDSAKIEFGRDTDYEFTAPVDLDEEGYRTLLLGMKPDTEYHLRVVAREGNTVYTSGDYTVETGPQANGLPSIKLDTRDEGALSGGFTIACAFGMGGGGGGGGTGGGWIFIIDEEGKYVWWYRSDQAGSDCVRARMSLDGKHLFVGNGNVPGPTGGTLIRVGMDGLDEKSYDVPRRHHDLAILPDGKIAYFEYDEGGGGGGGFGGDSCDIVKSLDPENGSTEVIYTITDDFSDLASQNGCHTNAVNYVPFEDALSLSILNFDTLIMISLSGDLIWTFGGPQSDFSGASWNAQHQHQVLEDSILLFNNQGSNGGSSALEYQLDGDSADLIFEYSSGLSTQSMGEAKRLPNGNTLVTYSNSGVTHEVDDNGALVQAINWGGGIGYTERRETLYGPPNEYR